MEALQLFFLGGGVVFRRELLARLDFNVCSGNHVAVGILQRLRSGVERRDIHPVRAFASHVAVGVSFGAEEICAVSNRRR